MPYRTLRLLTQEGLPETFWVRVPDPAVEAWLAERPRLRAQGYPDRPPDLDTPTLRAWLPRPGEGTLPYFRDGGHTHSRADPCCTTRTGTQM